LLFLINGLSDKQLGLRLGGFTYHMKIRAKKILAIITISSFALTIALLLGSSSQAGSTSAAFDGAALYRSKCASCHALDGSGNTAVGKSMKLRDLRSAEVQALSDAQLTEIIAKGKGKMPGYEKTVGAEGVAELVAYIRSMKQ